MTGLRLFSDSSSGDLGMAREKQHITLAHLTALIARIKDIAVFYTLIHSGRGENMHALKELQKFIEKQKKEHDNGATPLEVYAAIIEEMEKQYRIKENEKSLKDLFCCSGKSLVNKMNEKPNDYHYHRMLALTMKDAYKRFPDSFMLSPKAEMMTVKETSNYQFGSLDPLDKSKSTISTIAGKYIARPARPARPRIGGYFY